MPLEGETKHLPQCNAVPETIKNKNPAASTAQTLQLLALPAGDGPAPQFLLWELHLKPSSSVKAPGKRMEIQELC